MHIQAGWLSGVEHCPSPNYDERPRHLPVSLIVIHGISLPPGEYGGPWISELFLNRLDPHAHPYFATVADLRVSAHVLIRRDGHVIQYVSFDHRAWHAGQSSYEGRERCNDFSIGIELEGTDVVPYTEAQYDKLACVVRTLLVYYPELSSSRIAGHADIAPGRKSDPGPAFDWDYFRNVLLD